MNLGLRGRNALVLGASQGLGLGVARALLDEGARVAISSRSRDSLEAVRSSLSDEQRDRCFIIPADLGAEDAARLLADTARQELGQVDILVNNSGGPPTGLPSAISMVDVEAQFTKMVTPLMGLTLALVPAMRERGWGRVLTIASSGVIQPIPHLPISNSLRSALVGFMKTLAGEVAHDGVTVNILAPGRIATDRTRSIDAAAAARAGKSEDDIARKSAATIPAGRYGTPEEFGAVATFLAGAPASYVTGSIIRVDGGAIRSI
ncbi:3-oxoacyl-[acyl-carrier protein] reductase [Devosia crocina]|uniref:3-oxoacyl-[acyl-carrier protein] reductase n=1 Tax=Devosia crocina TaxID=429728 RepID=A0A1I7NVW3_9HYPH|nr:SDR family oxidoreductase [Devosia crocina]SFV38713.1 3-oxoacyl-[acyl-carrier protein] reductase [Devosia crocina]